MNFEKYLNESNDEDILKDAGFTPREIQDISRKTDSERMKLSKQGYLYVKGDFQQMTSKLVSMKEKENKADIENSKKVLKRIEAFDGREINAEEMVALTGIGDSRPSSKRDAISRWKWKIKDAQEGIDRYKRQLKLTRK